MQNPRSTCNIIHNYLLYFIDLLIILSTIRWGLIISLLSLQHIEMLTRLQYLVIYVRLSNHSKVQNNKVYRLKITLLKKKPVKKT